MKRGCVTDERELLLLCGCETFMYGEQIPLKAPVMDNTLLLSEWHQLCSFKVDLTPAIMTKLQINENCNVFQ
jgi:hypothetical protein